jgi:hypothetical protein
METFEVMQDGSTNVRLAHAWFTTNEHSRTVHAQSLES